MVRDLEEAEKLADVIRGNASTEFFYQHFGNRISEGFNPETHLRKIGVVNQTTMLATETQAIATLLKKAEKSFGSIIIRALKKPLCFLLK